MPARRHRFAICNHLGFGSFCHRCAQAALLEAQIEKSPRDKDAQSWANEASRLRGSDKNASALEPSLD